MSIKKTKIFWQLTDRGFGSEILLLAMGILFAEKNKLKFILNSEYSNFTIQNGWSDYFEPFCKEVKGRLYKKNFHFWESDKKTKTKKFRYKIKLMLFLGADTRLIHEAWPLIWNGNFEKELYSSKKYAYKDASCKKALSVVLSKIFKFNVETTKNINTLISKLNLPSNYLSFHIRRGDKVYGEWKEADVIDTKKFANTYTENHNGEDLYILTDDYSVIIELKKLLPETNIITLCQPEENGYNNYEFTNSSIEIRSQKIIKLLAEITICKNSKYFIGTYTTNLSRVIALLRDENNCLGIDMSNLPIIY